MKKTLLPLLLAVAIPVLSSAQKTMNSTEATTPKWWKESIIYQIYPRSFKDSDGDGIGDLKGITSELDYLKSLGITAIWLSPIYQSPNDDNGYDISDYRAIMKDFGTMADFDEMLKGMHQRGIKLIMDMVVNHSSDEHEWFKQSRSSRDNPYRNYYHWWNAERGKPTYRWSYFDVAHDAWKYDSVTNAYYLHYFSKKQPDLNWENPKLRQEVYDIMKFWAGKGTDGFRMDAFQFAAKDTTWPAFPVGYEKDVRNVIKYYGLGPHFHDYLKELNAEVLSKYDVMSVSEGAGSTLQDAHDLVDADRKELGMAYHFEAIDYPNSPQGFDLVGLKKLYSKWDSSFATKGWLSIFMANHDNARMVSKWGNDSPAFSAVSSKMLTTFVLSMRGTPYWYNGDELGMTNIRFNSIKDYRDVAAINEYAYVKNNSGDTAALLKNFQFAQRDNGRTPFQWNASANAGFTTGSPWLAVNPNYTTINEAAEDKDPASVLNYFRKMTALRTSTPALIYGKYTLLDAANPSVYAYTRELNGKKLLVLLNFKKEPATVNTGLNVSKAKVLISNYSTAGKSATLRPYEAVIYQL